MIASMTGYARAQGADDRRRWVWEARSVNGRNLEIRCRVPQGFDRLENPARTAVGGRLKRGNVSLTLTLTQRAPEQAAAHQPRPAGRAWRPGRGSAQEHRRRGAVGRRPAARARRHRGGGRGRARPRRRSPRSTRRSAATLDEVLKALVVARAAEGKALADGDRRPCRRDRGPVQARRRAGAGADRHRARALRKPARRAPGARAGAFRGAFRPGSGAAGRQGRRARGTRPAGRPHRPGARPCWPRRGRTIRSAASSISSARSSIARPTRCARSRPTSS